MKFITVLTIAVLCLGFVACRKDLKNPVVKKNLPDPGALFHNGSYYATATSGDKLGNKFPIYKSKDLQNWDLVGYAIPKDQKPKWALQHDAFWAPEIHKINGKFMLYYTARHPTNRTLSIGVAVADKIEGPYHDKGEPLVHNKGMAVIDATVLTTDKGVKYLVWKDDGNGKKPKVATWIWAQELSKDGLSVHGKRHQLLKNTLKWEADVTEGPWFIKKGDYYYMFYSGHGFCDKTYAVGVARSKNPLGPYVKKGDPILKSGNGWVGPGHCSVVEDHEKPGRWIMIYHSWEQGHVCGKGNARYLMADYVEWGKDGWPTMPGQTPRTIAKAK